MSINSTRPARGTHHLWGRKGTYLKRCIKCGYYKTRRLDIDDKGRVKEAYSRDQANWTFVRPDCITRY